MCDMGGKWNCFGEKWDCYVGEVELLCVIGREVVFGDGGGETRIGKAIWGGG